MSTQLDTGLEDLPALTPAGQRLLDAASDLFYDRGIRAVGVDLIAETAGTTKKTLYDRFGSKDALVALYLRRRALRWQEFLTGRLEESGPDAADQVSAVFDALRPGTRRASAAARSSTRTPSSAATTIRRWP